MAIAYVLNVVSAIFTGKEVTNAEINDLMIIHQRNDEVLENLKKHVVSRRQTAACQIKQVHANHVKTYINMDTTDNNATELTTRKIKNFHLLR